MFDLTDFPMLVATWSTSEYTGKIDNADELRESFLDNSRGEKVQVQLQRLTAIWKLCLKWLSNYGVHKMADNMDRREALELRAEREAGSKRVCGDGHCQENIGNGRP
jgi:hypothetical protein